MNLLKKESWLTNLLFFGLTQGVYIFIISNIMNLYEKNAWYTKWQYWVFGTLCLLFPVMIFFMVFLLQMYVKVAAALDVPGKELYISPYTWILCLVVPVIGWTLLIVMIIYIQIWIIVMLYRGNGEKYIK